MWWVVIILAFVEVILMLLQQVQNEVGLCIHCNFTSSFYLKTLYHLNKRQCAKDLYPHHWTYTVVSMWIWKCMYPWTKFYSEKFLLELNLFLKVGSSYRHSKFYSGTQFFYVRICGNNNAYIVWGLSASKKLLAMHHFQFHSLPWRPKGEKLFKFG